MKPAPTQTDIDELRRHMLELVGYPLIGRGYRGRDIRETLRRAAGQLNLLSTFLDLIMIYSVEEKEDFLWLKFAGTEICRVRATSPQGVALLQLEASRVIALSTTSGIKSET